MALTLPPWSKPVLLESGYESVASEYYDAELHPTCANLREASSIALTAWLTRINSGVVLEVGAGKSLAAEILSSSSFDLNNMIISDVCESMLEYSRPWSKRGAKLMCISAESLPLPDASVDTVVASLGDPYNHTRFWIEAKRVLRKRGQLLFTTPSYEWASTYRCLTGSPGKAATFITANAEQLFLPSSILPINDQVSLIASLGLNVDETREVQLSELQKPISSKLKISDTDHLSVLTAFRVVL
jgi:SAM-dependent methyltransferase